MRRAKRFESLKYLIVAVIAAAATSAFFLLHHRGVSDNTPPQSRKQQTGYKAEDRQKLEQLIHQGARDD